MSQDFEKLKDEINRFVGERDWDQFHTPKNLSMALSVEVSELMEHFLWVDADTSDEALNAKRDEIRMELADIFIYLMRLSEVCDIDLPEAVLEKMEINREKYPVDKVKGSSKKYTEY